MRVKPSKIKLIFPVLGILLLSGCKLIDPPEPVPAYININGAVLNTSPGTQGSGLHGFSDVWVYVDDNLQGLYEMPVTFPILREGPQILDIRAGIKNNGTGSNRIVYPFVTTYTVTTDLKPEETDTITPIFSYKPNVKFPYLESFESGISLKVDTAQSSVDTIYRVGPGSPEVLEGQWCGLIDLGSGTNQFLCATQSEYELPGQGEELMFEMNYRTNTGFTVGVVLNNINGTTQSIIQYPIVTVNFIDNSWKKIYINLRDDVSYLIGTNPGINRFRIFIRTNNSNQNLSPKIYLDNLKLLHFE
jgi:hypothetical protein